MVQHLKEANRIGSAIYTNEIPKQYSSKYKLIGRGTTSIIYDYDADSVLVFTRDPMKMEYNREIFGNDFKYLDSIESYNLKLNKAINDKDIHVYLCPKLYKLSPKNRKYCQKLIDVFHKLLRKFSLYGKFKPGSEYQFYNYYTKYVETYSRLFKTKHVTEDFINWVCNYDKSQFEFDLHMGNFMQDKQGRIVLIDPVVDTEILNFFRKKQW